MNNVVVRYPRMDDCSHCAGHGIRTGTNGEPQDCAYCGGSGLREARNARGQFMPWIEITDDEMTAAARGYFETTGEDLGIADESDLYLNEPQRGGSLPEDQF